MRIFKSPNIICCLVLFIYTNSFCQKGIGINKIQLKTINNKDFKITTLHKKLIGIVFLSPDCPLSQNYTLVLNKLMEKYNADIDLIGIFSGKDYSIEEYKKFSIKYKVSFPLVVDKTNRYAKTFTATITPEVFLINQQKNILYSGAIDNWAISLGKQMKKPTINYLEDAIKGYLNNEIITLKRTTPVGCLINSKINSN